MKIITQGGFGPKMKALPNDNWRDFVLLYCAQGRHKASRAYAEVYDRPLPEQQNTNRVEAYKLVHDERVQDAILEVCQRTLRSLAPAAIEVLADVAENGQGLFSASERLKAAGMIMDRTALHGTTEHKTSVEHLGQDADQMKRIANMAVMLGLDPAVLLGRRLAQESNIIDITPAHVQHEEPSEW